MRRGPLTSACLLLTCLAVAPAQAAAPRLDVPKGFVRHTSSPYWTWYAPKGWIDSYGANGILITSPTGTAFNDYGQGATPCPSDVTAYFNSVSSYYKNKKALYTSPLKGLRYTSRGKVRQLDTAYFRQRLTWKGTRRNGAAVQGEVIFDIFAVDATDGVCGQRTQNRGAPSKGFAASLRTLRAIQGLIFYNSQPVTRH